MRADGRSLLFLAALLSVGPSVRLSAQWLPGERVLLTDFSQVDALAASAFTLYAATRRGLLVYDLLTQTWRRPVTALDGYPVARVRLALADPVNDGVWLRADAGWTRYDPMTRRLEPAAEPPPERRTAALDVADALRQAPVADAMRALILTDARLRAHRFTAAARPPDGRALFLGTSGMGVVRLDPETGQWQVLAFGLTGSRAGAIQLATGAALWVAAGGRPGERSGLTRVGEDLATTEPIEDEGATGGLDFVEARDLAAGGGALWLATERGLYRLERSSRPQPVEGLDRVWCLVPAADGVWVGTDRGIVHVGPTVREAHSTGSAVLSLARLGDTLWIGTVRGLGRRSPAAPGVTAPAELTQPPALRAGIVALAAVGDTLVAATRDQLAWRNPGDGAWVVLRPAANLGRITVLATDAAGVWVGGTAGLAHWTIATGALATLRVPTDVPAPVRDVAARGAWVWVASDSGLVRFDREAALVR